jgi:hypothetical protein
LVVDDAGGGEKNSKPEAPPLGDGMVAEAVAAGVIEVSSGVGVVIICCIKPKPELGVGAGLASAAGGGVGTADTPPVIISPSLSSLEGAEGDKKEKALAAAGGGGAASWGLSTVALVFIKENTEDVGSAGAGADDMKEKALAGAAAGAGASEDSSFFLSDPFKSKPPNILRL